MGLSLWATFAVKGTFNKYNKLPIRSGLSGAEAAAAILRAAGVHDVQIAAVPGMLSDHYDPQKRVVGLSEEVLNNRTQAAAVDIPVIAFGGSNGLTPAPAAWLDYAEALARCAAPTCDGATGRVVDRANPSEAFPTFGDVDGGFEVYISEGYSHVDIVSADDDETNNVIGPLLAFIDRNLQ